MNIVPVSALLTSPARLAGLTAKRHDRVELLDEPDLRQLVRILAVCYPHAFDAAWTELCGGAA